ncbi:MAG TPA: Dyp-type peroxidase, partial [Actinomycetales bacterium]|nr:Dyp-type peroxidase [Actinomycetales bacterium]
AALGAGGALALGGVRTPSGKVVYAGDLTVPWHGENQPGITTTPQGFLTLVAFDLEPGVDRTRLGRLMRIWTDDISRLAEGRPSLTDTEPELALDPARLTFTVGFGPGLFEKAGMASERPEWLRQLPPYPQIDQLEDRWSEGDLVLQVCGEDPNVVTHAARQVSKSAGAYAKVRWVQRGYRNAAGQVRDGATFRNQFGQLDGTSNLQGEEDEFVWITADSGAPSWLVGGTSMVVRRIFMDLDTWDHLDRPGREITVGRTLGEGGPLTGGGEFDDPDLEARNELGFPAIDSAAHIRRSRTEDPSQRFLRRPYNYDADEVGLAAGAEGVPNNHGLVFITFQKDLEHQYLPVQERLAELDLLNQWTVPIGSAVFAVPRGVREGEWLAQDLFG